MSAPNPTRLLRLPEVRTRTGLPTSTLYAMMADGLEDEVRALAAMGFKLGQGPLASPGYGEVGQYLAGDIPLAEAVQRAKYRTHRLVRRQYSWFKQGDPRISWLDAFSSISR